MGGKVQGGREGCGWRGEGHGAGLGERWGGETCGRISVYHPENGQTAATAGGARDRGSKT